jgi:glycosyltransferase involved in cell wall biosynthesis
MSISPYLPLVSIITPSYNQAVFLEETIESVLSQTGVQLEYYVIDGGSTDGSVEIIQRYSHLLTGWVSEPDNGQAEAINKGFNQATGKYIAWLNSDDLYLPNAVSQAVSALEANPALGLVYGDAISIDPRGAVLNPLTFGDWGLDDLLGFRIICQPAVFMRRSILSEAGYLDPSYQYMLDHQLWLRMARLAPIQHIPNTLAAARQHPGAKNVLQAAAFGDEILNILNWIANQPDYQAYYSAQRSRITAGAYRLKARYLLDGGQPGPALKAYFRALRHHPGFTLQHWHRMLYAALSLVGLGKLDRLYYRLARQRNSSAMLTPKDPQP